MVVGRGAAVEGSVRYNARPQGWGSSSDGRAPRSQRGGRGFDSLLLHHPCSLRSLGWWRRGLLAGSLAALGRETWARFPSGSNLRDRSGFASLASGVAERGATGGSAPHLPAKSASLRSPPE